MVTGENHNFSISQKFTGKGICGFYYYTMRLFWGHWTSMVSSSICQMTPSWIIPFRKNKIFKIAFKNWFLFLATNFSIFSPSFKNLIKYLSFRSVWYRKKSSHLSKCSQFGRQVVANLAVPPTQWFLDEFSSIVFWSKQ